MENVVGDVFKTCNGGFGELIDSLKAQNGELFETIKQQNGTIVCAVENIINDLIQKSMVRCNELEVENRALKNENQALKDRLEKALVKIGEFEKMDANFKLANKENPHVCIPIDMREAAHIISCNAYKLIIGRNKLMKYLRVLKYLDKDNKPYQKYINDKYFKVEITRCGSFMNSKTCFTQKGIQLLQNKILQAISDAEQLGYDFTKGGE